MVSLSPVSSVHPVMFFASYRRIPGREKHARSHDSSRAEETFLTASSLSHSMALGSHRIVYPTEFPDWTIRR